MSIENKNNKWFQGSLLVTLLVALGYFEAFIYEMGYFSAFQIPYEFIQIELNVILLFIMAFLGFTAIFSHILNIFFLVGSEIKDKYWKIKFMTFSLYLLLLIGFIVIFGNLFKEWVWFAVFISVMLLIEFLIPLLTHKDKGTYKEKLYESDKNNDEAETFYDFMIKKFGIKVFIIFFLLFISSIFINAIGKSKALKKVAFPILVEEQLIVLRTYSDRLICIDLKGDKKREYTIIDLDKCEKISFNIDKIGPLKINDEDKYAPSISTNTKVKKQ